MSVTSGKPTSATNPEGDTKKVNRNLVLIVFSKEVTKYTKDTTTGKLINSGTTKIVKNNLLFYLTENLINYYNIPTFTPPAASSGAALPPLPDIKATEYDRSLTIDGTNKITVKRRGYKIFKAAGNGRKRGKAIKLALPDKKTSKGNPRFVEISFPGFFTVPMIMQALGTMLKAAQKDRQPETFKMKDTGSTYPIPYAANAGAVVPGWGSNGAWLATALITPENIDNLGDGITGQETVVSAAGDLNG